MVNRRSFFQKIATAVAVLALAPQIAFRQKLALPEAPLGDFWLGHDLIARVTSEAYREWQQQLIADNPFYAEMDRAYEIPLGV